MGNLIDGDDGLPAESVKSWSSREKHEYLARYVDISRGVRNRWLKKGGAGATYIDLFCGTGRCQIKETGEWVDGGAVVAWKKSCEAGSPFSQVFVSDIDGKRSAAMEERLKKTNAPVFRATMAAVDAAAQIREIVNPYALHFAFLDPYNLESLDFRIISSLARLKRIDMLVHVSQMDLQRNVVTNAIAEESAFDIFAPGWRENIDVKQGHQAIRREIFDYWRDKVASTGAGTAADMKLIRGEKQQPLYLLLLASKNNLAHKFWKAAINIEGQKTFDF